MNLEPFKNLIKERCGLIFEGISERPLLNGLNKRILETNSSNLAAYFSQVKTDEHEFHELICLLTINETYFYRESEQLKFLVDHLIPRLLSRKQESTPIRILSAGCSSGEEIYSIAIALSEKYGETADRLFWLAGGDIDKKILSKARAASYAEYSFRSFSPELRERYFERQQNSSWIVQDEIRQRVHFYHLNLLAEHYPVALQNFDIIFFRNVSIYFDSATRLIIQQHLASLLNENGTLMIGLTETHANDFGIMNLLEEKGIFYFSKSSIDSIKPHANMLLPVTEAVSSEALLHSYFDAEPIPAVIEPFFATAIPAAIKPAETLASVPVAETLNFIKEKRYSEAMQLIESALALQPEDLNALLLKAYIGLNQKNYLLTEEVALQVLTMDNWSIDAFVLLGLAAKWREQPAEAAKWFKQAAYACHDCWTAHYYLAELYKADNAAEKSRRAYRVVLQLLSTAAGSGSGFAVIPTDLPVLDVRFLCEHQLSKLDVSPHDTVR